jgi:hypothetical protein
MYATTIVSRFIMMRESRIWCERGTRAKSPPPEPIAVDDHVEPEEEGAQPVRDHSEGAQGDVERRPADDARQPVGLEAAKPGGDRRAHGKAGEMLRESRAQRGLVLEKRHPLRHQRRDREEGDEKREDEEGREDDRDPEPAPHSLPFEPADGGAQRAGDEEGDDEHEEDRPEPDQQPEGSGDENEQPHGLW